MIHVIAKNYVQPDKLDTFKDLTVELIAETRKEEGCLFYDLFQDFDDPTILTFIEKWESRSHLDAHMKTAHFEKIVPQLGQCQSKEGVLNIYKDL